MAKLNHIDGLSQLRTCNHNCEHEEPLRLTLLGLPLELQRMIWEALLVTPFPVKSIHSRKEPPYYRVEHDSNGALIYRIWENVDASSDPDDIDEDDEDSYTSYVSPRGKPRQSRYKIHTDIMSTCRSVHREASTIFYSQNIFHYPDTHEDLENKAYSMPLRPRRWLSRRYHRSVRKVHMNIISEDPSQNETSKLLHLIHNLPNLRVLTLELRTNTYQHYREWLKSLGDDEEMQILKAQFHCISALTVSGYAPRLDFEIKLRAPKKTMAANQPPGWKEMVVFAERVWGGTIELLARSGVVRGTLELCSDAEQ